MVLSVTIGCVPSVTSPLNLVRSLANTLNGGSGTDPLATRDDAAAWLRAAALLPDDGSLSGSEHAAFLRLRGAVRDVLTARADGVPGPDAAARLTRALADGRLVVTVAGDGGVKLASSARSPYPNAVAAIAIAIAEAAASGAF